MILSKVNQLPVLVLEPEKWTMVPVLVKIYKLIINDLRNQLMNKLDEEQVCDDDDDEVRTLHNACVTSLIFAHSNDCVLVCRVATGRMRTATEMLIMIMLQTCSSTITQTLPKTSPIQTPLLILLMTSTCRCAL